MGAESNVFRLDSKSKFQPQEYHTLSEVTIRAETTPKNPEKENERELLWEKILECESGNSHRDSNGEVKCNGQFGCNGGIGISQLVPSTVETCEEELGKEVDAFDKEDNLECGRWLFENEGWQHWGDSSTWWGSYDCFQEYVKYY